MINVTKTFLPPFNEYSEILKRAWDKAWITNNGALVEELEQKLKSYLSTDHLLYTSNGTVVLQMALKALEITGEVITTPFSYVATTNAILWENCTPIFVDINSDTFCIDADKIEAAITPVTTAILATHVYGLPCDVEAIEAIAAKHNLKVIYDGAHAFGCTYKGKALLDYGDVSTCSFHATKIFHTVEGGCIISNAEPLFKKLYLYRSFGHIGDDYYSMGINGKNSEFHAAMGLANLPYLEKNIAERKEITELYTSLLHDKVETINFKLEDFTSNYCYYPVIFKNEVEAMHIKSVLLENDVAARRYFYPSLNELPFLSSPKIDCPISEDISRRILALPLYNGMEKAEIEFIAKIIRENLL